MAEDESKFVPQDVVGPKTDTGGQVGQTSEAPPDAQSQTPEQTQADFELTPEQKLFKFMAEIKQRIISLLETLEVSLEDTDKILSKVVDVTDNDLGFHVIGAIQHESIRGDLEVRINNLQKILKNGLLSNYEGQDQKMNPRDWSKRARTARVSNKVPYVWFNITSKSAGGYLSGHWHSDFGVLFDLSHFKKIDPSNGEKTRNRTYMSSRNGGSGNDTEFGYKLFSRVSPKMFKGLVISQDKNIPEGLPVSLPELEKLKEGLDGYEQKIFMDLFQEFDSALFRFDLSEYQVSDKSKLHGEIKDVIKLMFELRNNLRFIRIIKAMKDVYTKRTDALFPVYDTNGNLLWPRQMSHEEVKKFVAERDVKKGGE
jgi:hypothetical protein